MRWGSAVCLGFVFVVLMAAPAQGATAEIGAVGFVNAGGVPDVNPALPADPFYLGVQAAESNPIPSGFRPYVIPAGYGVITQWSHSAGPTPGHLTMVAMRRYYNANNPTLKWINAGSDPRIVTANTVQRFNVRMPVKPGDRLLLAADQEPVRLAKQGNPAGNVVEQIVDYGVNDPQDVERERIGYLLDVAARVETDADGDGYGDDTQDGCPSRADTQKPCLAPNPFTGNSPIVVDVLKPRVDKFKIFRPVFRAASSGKAIGAGGRVVPVGTRVAFTASEISAVKFRVQRRAAGRKVGKKCKAPTRGNRKKKRCIRYPAVKGSFTITALTGTNSFSFRGRMGGRKLKPGRYRLAGRATDRAKNSSEVAPVRFRIVE